ncbi:MAG: metalloregulator ArsR/SmtB family transcription factor [Pyrinomonadaceae bacterium]
MLLDQEMDLQDTTFIELEKLFLALSNKTRLRLLALMAAGEVPVGFLADRLNISQPKVSRHLAYLRNAGVVGTRRDGKWIHYGIVEPADPALSRILNTVIESIATIGVDGNNGGVVENLGFVEKLAERQHDTYEYPYENVEGTDTALGRDDSNDIDIFLL